MQTNTHNTEFHTHQKNKICGFHCGGNSLFTCTLPCYVTLVAAFKEQSTETRVFAVAKFGEILI